MIKRNCLRCWPNRKHSLQISPSLSNVLIRRIGPLLHCRSTGWWTYLPVLQAPEVCVIGQRFFWFGSTTNEFFLEVAFYKSDLFTITVAICGQLILNSTLSNLDVHFTHAVSLLYAVSLLCKKIIQSDKPQHSQGRQYLLTYSWGLGGRDPQILGRGVVDGSCTGSMFESGDFSRDIEVAVNDPFLPVKSIYCVKLREKIEIFRNFSWTTKKL